MINIRTVFNSPLGNPVRLQEELSRRGIYQHHSSEPVLGYREVGLWRWSLYFFLEYAPKRLLAREPRDIYTFTMQERCLPLASDIPIVLSLWKVDIPNYSFIIGKRRNLVYGEQCPVNIPTSFIPFAGRGRLDVYAYSEKGFHFPGESFRGSAVLSVDLFEPRSLILLKKDGSVYKVFNQNSIRERIDEPGSYQLIGYTYQFRIWKLFFGLRFAFCTPPFYAM